MLTKWNTTFRNEGYKVHLDTVMEANFYNVDQRRIERYRKQFSDELKKNGYGLLKGDELKRFQS